jgi:hypothetical protein
MNELFEKVAQIERQIAEAKGPFTLFALFERDNLPTRFELVFAAPWVDDKGKALREFVAVLKEHLSLEQMISLSRVIILDPCDEPVRSFTSAFDVEHGRLEVREENIFGLPIGQGLIITSRRAA